MLDVPSTHRRAREQGIRTLLRHRSFEAEQQPIIRIGGALKLIRVAAVN
jgi:hypothetical protein